MPKTFSPHHTALSIVSAINRRYRGRTLSTQELGQLWHEVLEEHEPPITGDNISYQWLRLRTSIQRIERQQQRLAKSGNLSQRQMQRRIQQRTQDSMTESARRLVIMQAMDDEAHAGGQSMARMLHTAADEPDLAHAMLEGMVMPLTDVLRELERFGCQHEYEIVEVRPVRASKLWGAGTGLEDSIPPAP